MHTKIPAYVVLVLFFLLTTASAQTPAPLNGDVEKVKTLLTEHAFGQAIALCNKNMAQSIKNKDPETHSWFLSVKAMAYLDTLSADSALLFFEKSLAEAYHINYKKSICNSLYGLGKYYYHNSEYLTAIKYFQLLNYYSENAADKNYQLIAAYYLSSNYNLLGKRTLAITHARKAARLAYEIRDTLSYIKSLLSVGAEFFTINNLDSTDYYTQKANTVYSFYSKKNVGISSDIYNSLLKTEIIRRNFTKAIGYGLKAVEACITDNDLTSLNIFYDNLATCYTHKKQYDSATYYYEKALDLELKYNYVDEYKTDLKELFYINKLANNTGKAFYYIEKYMSADSLYQEARGNAVDSLKTAFEFEKSAMTLKADQEKLHEAYEKKQLVYLSTGIILLLLLTGIPYAIYLRKLLKREKEKQNLLIQVKDSEIKALQSQMNPHFIFNCLNSVLEFISKSEADAAIKYLTKFSRLIRLVLEFSNRKNIRIAKELELLSVYVELEKIRSGFNFTVTIDKELDPDHYMIPSMLLQPFIENSIIHGILNKAKVSEQENKTYKGDLHLFISKNNNVLSCVIEDNGIGFEQAEAIKKNKVFNHLSLGMRITKDRLSLLSENNCTVTYMDLKDENGNSAGTRVEILIPLLEIF